MEILEIVFLTIIATTILILLINHLFYKNKIGELKEKNYNLNRKIDGLEMSNKYLTLRNQELIKQIEELRKVSFGDLTSADVRVCGMGYSNQSELNQSFSESIESMNERDTLKYKIIDLLNKAFDRKIYWFERSYTLLNSNLIEGQVSGIREPKQETLHRLVNSYGDKLEEFSTEKELYRYLLKNSEELNEKLSTNRTIKREQ
jgi:enoyl reductase-like protein